MAPRRAGISRRMARGRRMQHAPTCPPPPHARLPPTPAAGTQTEAFVDFVVGHGELWSAQLMALACQQMVWAGTQTGAAVGGRGRAAGSPAYTTRQRARSMQMRAAEPRWWL
jgi:aspartokinase